MWQFLKGLHNELLVIFWGMKKTWILIGIIYESVLGIYSRVILSGAFIIQKMFYGMK